MWPLTWKGMELQTGIAPATPAPLALTAAAMVEAMMTKMLTWTRKGHPLRPPCLCLPADLLGILLQHAICRSKRCCRDLYNSKRIEECMLSSRGSLTCTQPEHQPIYLSQKEYSCRRRLGARARC